MNFTEDQKEFLKKVYNVNVTNSEHILKILDGYAKPGDTVYWHCQDGLSDGSGAEEFVYTWNGKHRKNMINFPNIYSLKKPEIVTSYSIDYQGA